MVSVRSNPSIWFSCSGDSTNNFPVILNGQGEFGLYVAFNLVSFPLDVWIINEAFDSTSNCSSINQTNSIFNPNIALNISKYVKLIDLDFKICVIHHLRLGIISYRDRMVASISGNKESGLENRSQIKKFTIDTCQFRFHLSCSDWPRAVQRDRARERRLQGLCVYDINARGRQSCHGGT